LERIIIIRLILLVKIIFLLKLLNGRMIKMSLKFNRIMILVLELLDLLIVWRDQPGNQKKEEELENFRKSIKNTRQ
jgi:hypothetical protein